MSIYIITLLIAGTTFFIVLAILQMLFKDKLLIIKRIDGISSNKQNETKDMKNRKLKQDRSVDSKVKILKRLVNELSLSGVLIRPSEFLVIWIALSLVPSSFFLMVSHDIIVALALFLVGVFLPPLFLHRKKVKRVELFEKQLAEAVTIICNCLRAGLTFQQAIESIANEMSEPISKEFGRVIREMKLGNTIEKSLSNMADRLGSKDFILMVSAILIQRQTGGNLSEILSSIAVTITERYKIKSEIKVLTTTGRTSGMVVGTMPIGILLFFMLINPGYVKSFFDTNAGIAMLIAAAVLETIGYLIIRKIVNVKY